MFITNLFLRTYFWSESIELNIIDMYKAYDTYCWIAFPRGCINLYKITNAWDFVIS